ncbi:hypothetical protein [Nostoc sp.]
MSQRLGKQQILLAGRVWQESLAWEITFEQITDLTISRYYFRQ